MLVLIRALQYVTCDGDGYYSYWLANCLSVGECFDKKWFPYSLGKVCIGTPPDRGSGMYIDEHGAYACPPDKYIIFKGVIAKCVDSPAECAEFYVSEEKHACLNSSWICTEYAHSYGHKDSFGLHCISRADCTTKYDGYIYDYDCLSPS